MFFRNHIFFCLVSLLPGPLAWSGATFQHRSDLKNALIRATSLGRPLAENKRPDDSREKESSTAALVRKAISESSDLDTVKELIQKSPQIETHLKSILESVKRGDLPTEEILKELSVSLGDSFGENAKPEEVARFLVNALADQKNPENDAFFKLAIDSAEKKQTKNRNSVEKAVIAYADRLREKVGKNHVEELAKKTGITEQQVALRLNKMNQFLESKQGATAAEIAADWLINLPPKTRASIADKLFTDAPDGALGVLKSGAALVRNLESGNTLAASATSNLSADVEKAFKTTWKDNVKYAKDWARDVKDMDAETLKKKYSPSETWLAQAAANGSETALEAIKKVALTKSEGVELKISTSNLSGDDAKPTYLKAQTPEQLASLVTQKKEHLSWDKLAAPQPAEAKQPDVPRGIVCDGTSCRPAAAAVPMPDFYTPTFPKPAVAAPPGLEPINPKEGDKAVVCCSASNCGPCTNLLLAAGIGEVPTGISRFKGEGGVVVIINKQEKYQTGNRWHPGSGFPSVRSYEFRNGTWVLQDSSREALINVLRN
jgi:hypothetical protein